MSDVSSAIADVFGGWTELTGECDWCTRETPQRELAYWISDDPWLPDEALQLCPTCRPGRSSLTGQ